MMNFIKSEFYRITHTKDIYLITGILTTLVLLLHASIYFFGGHYKNTSFSFSILVVNPMIFAVMGSIIAFILYEGNRKNGTQKNTVATGISRDKIFLGECVVSMVTATVIMIVLLSVWILSADILLPENGPVRLQDLLLEAPMTYLIAAACLISGLLFLELFEKNIFGILAWLCIWFIIPKILIYAGIRFEAIYDIAMWLPDNFFAINNSHVNTRECITVWDTAEGMIKCVLSGGIGVIIFTLSGVISLKKKDL